MLEAWADDPPHLIIFENVPRIATRGRPLIDQILQLLRAYGFAANETTHDCGEIGNLGQSRKRYLLVARHMEKVPPFLYEPPKRGLRGVGEILDKFPLPGDIAAAGPMHRMPALQWKTWVRLAFVKAGSDWRSLKELRVEDGHLTDFGIVPAATAWHDGALGVLPWSQHAGTITAGAEPTSGRFAVADPRAEGGLEGSGFMGVRAWDRPTGVIAGESRPSNGAYSVADPRPQQANQSYHQYGVRSWEEPSSTVTGQNQPGGGPNAVADPRVGADGPRFNNVYRIVGYDQHAPAVTGQGGNSAAAVADPRGGATRHVNGKYRITRFDQAANAVIAASTTGNGACAVADPRPTHGPNAHQNKMRVEPYDGPAHAVTGSDRVGSGALSVADPRPVCLNREDREGYMTQGHYGVLGWGDHSGAVPAFAKNNNGAWSVADPREAEGEPAFALPAGDDRLVAVIRALDGTWHRPFTTLELAALQSLVDPDELFTLEGQSDSAWRERIGNAVPSAAAEAIASTMGQTLLLAWAGESFMLSSQPIWVQPLAVALAVDTGAQL